MGSPEKKGIIEKVSQKTMEAVKTIIEASVTFGILRIFGVTEKNLKRWQMVFLDKGE